VSNWDISHDFAYHYGGAERVTEILAHDVAPDASIYLLGGDEAVVDRMELTDRVDWVFSPRLLTSSNYRIASSLMAPAIPRLAHVDGNLISSSYAFSHHLRCEGTHVSYCHSPLRQIWSHEGAYAAEESRLRRESFGVLASGLRRLNKHAANGVDEFIATSSVVKDRIERFYEREVLDVIPPPVDTHAFFRKPDDVKGEHFLWVGRIVEPYKKLTPVVEAFEGLDEQLIVVGSGRDENAIKVVAPKNVKFYGSIGSAELRDHYASARALIFPSEDDFGMVPIEAIACGTPVIAFRGGGALDTIVEGETGIFFDEPTPRLIRAAIEEFQTLSWDDTAFARESEKFSREAFVRRISDALSEAEK
jgi:glycosyltransferase involved in cell wall biosynthesis